MATMGDRKTGKQLERFIAMLESALANTGATIEAPSRSLRDRDTGQAREHDVLITWDHGHHQIYTAIECRDRSRPIGVPAVSEFADKCASTGVHHGVMVSASGFQKTARKKAASRGITCMDIAEVAGFDWLATDATFTNYERNCIKMHARIMFDGGQPDALAAVYDTNGKQLNENEIMNCIVQSIQWSDEPENDVGRAINFNLHVITIGWTAKDTQGAIWPISHILAEAEFTVTKYEVPLQSHRYSGGGKDYSFVSADAKLGDKRGRFILLRNEDDTTTVSWAPDNHGIKPTKRNT